MDEALTFDDGHICKRSPTEITEFYLQTADSSEFFREVVDVDLNVVNTPENDNNNNKENVSSHAILVELAGRMIGLEQEQEQKGLAEVTSSLS